MVSNVLLQIVGSILLQKALKTNGKICILSDGNIEELTLTANFYQKELQIIGSSDGYDYQKHADWFLKK